MPTRTEGAASSPRWTHEAEARLRALYLEGATYAEIGRTLGVTREAVCGKIHRLKLPKRTASSPVAEVRKRLDGRLSAAARPALATKSNGTPLRKRGATQALSAPCAPLPVEERPAGPLVALGFLTDTTCKWPFGDPRSRDFGFCGAPHANPGPYCDPHARRAFTPASKRRLETP